MRYNRISKSQLKNQIKLLLTRRKERANDFAEPAHYRIKTKGKQQIQEIPGTCLRAKKSCVICIKDILIK